MTKPALEPPLPDRIIRAAEARRRFAGVAHSTWWKWSQRSDFPRRYRLGPRLVGWSVRELENYFERQRDAPSAGA